MSCMPCSVLPPLLSLKVCYPARDSLVSYTTRVSYATLDSLSQQIEWEGYVGPGFIIGFGCARVFLSAWKEYPRLQLYFVNAAPRDVLTRTSCQRILLNGRYDWTRGYDYITRLPLGALNLPGQNRMSGIFAFS